jgi:heme A synthase
LPAHEPADGRPPLSLRAVATASAAPSILVQVHERLGFAMIAVFLIGMVAAALATRWSRYLPTVRVYLWLAFVAVAVQGLLGLGLVITGDRPGDGLHYLYGPLTFLALPVAAAISPGGSSRREAWVLAAGFLFALLFSIRSLGTA